MASKFVPNVCIPMNVDAFSLSPQLCDETMYSKVAPFTQPNYTALRLDGQFLKHDVLDHIDFHATQPAKANARISNIGNNPDEDPLKYHRLGVHLSWSLPRFYRTATASGRQASGTENSRDAKDPAQPVFRKIPNRWLVTRRMKVRHKDGHGIPEDFPEYQSWIIESDVVRSVKTVEAGTDLESDVAPFVSYEGDPSDPNVLNDQTEILLGQKFDLKSYQPDQKRQYMKNGLTVMSSSNPLFADSAMHNCNVLSTIDNFAYRRNEGDRNPRDNMYSYLSYAKCDYYIIGWHHDGTQDPVNLAFDTSYESILDSRLRDMMLKLQIREGGSTAISPDSKGHTICLVHGAIYDVIYDFAGKPGKSIAEDGARLFVNSGNKNPPSPDDLKTLSESDREKVKIEQERMEPLSIGTTPLDAILTFLDAHENEPDDENVFGAGGGVISHEIMQLAQLLYAAGDGYDARVQAQDLIAQQNFSRTEGGSFWTLANATSGNGVAKKDSKPRIPTDDEKITLRIMNEKQMQLDACIRQNQALKWELFAEWFKFKSEFLPRNLDDRARVLDRYRNRVDELTKKIILNGSVPSAGLASGSGMIGELKQGITDLQSKVDCKLSTRQPFRKRQDPTLCIAGLDSGWPIDSLDRLVARLDNTLDTDATSEAVVSSFLDPVPIGLQTEQSLKVTMKKLLAECIEKGNSNVQNGASASEPLLTSGFRAWGNTNPFVPLFIEWEGLYYHIDDRTAAQSNNGQPSGKSKRGWDVQFRPSPVGHPQSQFRYVPASKPLLSDPSNGENQKDFRSLSGRVQVLPQPRVNLEDIVLQVLDSKSPGLPPDTNSDDIKKNLSKIKVISAPLAGITNHLLTRCEGAHVKPNVRTQGEVVVPLDAAITKDINLDKENLKLIDSQSNVTPYGSLFEFGKDRYPNNPFKPVTQGQMLITKLNIVDKFGQAICLPRTNRRKRIESNPPDAGIYPCLSDSLAPDIIKSSPHATTGVLNTVFPTPATEDGKWPLSQFFQLSPSINQDARINASFLTRDTVGPKTYSPWREATDYESPIWGWLIVNYADNGLQFFLGDGTFYREVRRGGVDRTNLSTKWLPYDPPAKGLEPTDAGTKQLDELLDRLSPSNDMDGSYLQAFFNMINSAIQNMPFAPSSYAGYANAIVGKPLALVNVGWSIELAENPIRPQFDSLDHPTDGMPDELLQYEFELKIGDHERNFDGVVGYFTCDNTSTPVQDASQTDFKKLYTYFPPKEDHPMFSEIKDEFPLLSPYYIDPSPSTTPNYSFAQSRQYTVTSILMDPYTPIHGYSPILPTVGLTVAPWAVQTAMDKMHAFFHLGPSLFTVDVPPTYEAATTKKADGSVPSVRLPLTGQKGAWTWLQPYEQADVDGKERPARFAQMGVLEDQGAIKWEKAPYTFLEGYLQLMGRLDNAGLSPKT